MIRNYIKVITNHKSKTLAGGDFYSQASERNENDNFISERALGTRFPYNRFAH